MGGGARAATTGGVSGVGHVAEAGAAIRPALASDLDGVVAIEAASFSDPWTRGSFRTLVAVPHVYFPVVEDAAGVTAFAIALFAADESELANLAVAPERRGRGLGARLLDEVMREAERRGARTMWLEVRESNAAARRLYAARGFVDAGRRRRYYADPVEDALVLRRTF